MRSGTRDARPVQELGWAAKTARFGAIAASLTILALSLVGTASAFWGDQRYGLYYLPASSIGASLDGTRAWIAVFSLSPGSSTCPGMASAMTNTANGQQMQIGIAQCAPGYSIDGTCSLSNNVVLFVERRADGFGSYTCYPHGPGVLGANYLLTVDDSGSGNMCTYSGGNPYECQTWYDTTASVAEEWAEAGQPAPLGEATCFGWGLSGQVANFEYWTLTWSGWQFAGPNSSAYAGCYSLGGISNSSWSISH